MNELSNRLHLDLWLDQIGTASDKFNVGQPVAIANDLLQITEDFLKPLEN
jgi:hypothetical protein